MAELLILLGALCVVTAIVGGGLEVASLGKMPVVDSAGRQLALALCGAALIAGGLVLRSDDKSGADNDQDYRSRCRERTLRSRQ